MRYNKAVTQRCSVKSVFLKISKNSLKNTIVRVPWLRPANLLKKRFWHKYFTVNFAKFLRKPFWQNTSDGCFLFSSSYAAQNHCVKSVCIRSYSSPHFSAFRLNTEILRIESECGKMRTRITSSRDTFTHRIDSKVATQRSFIKSVFVMQNTTFRDVFRALWDIWNGEFLANSRRILAVNYFHKTLDFRCLTGIWIDLGY